MAKGKYKQFNNNDFRNAHSRCIPPTAPNYGHASYPNVPNVPASSANCNWGSVHGEEIHGDDQMSGYIFMCNEQTKEDCYRYRVFGLPALRIEDAEKIKPHMKLFLFDFDAKLLYGIYVAASTAKLAIEPTAFGGRFPAQVRFEIFKECLPLPESAFKHVIKDNYRSTYKFKQELSGKQVADLVSLFRPLFQSPPNIPHISHPLSATVAGLQQAIESIHLVPQPQQNQFTEAAQHTYVSQHPSSYRRDTPKPGASGWRTVPQPGNTIIYYNHNAGLSTSNALVQPNALPFQMSTSEHAYVPSSSTTGLTAAHWAQVAAAAAESMNGPMAYPSVVENRGKETALNSHALIGHNHNMAYAASYPPPRAQSFLPLQFQAPTSGPEPFLLSSNVASYLVQGAENVPCFISGAASGLTTVSQPNSANEAIHHNGTISWVNTPSQISSETAGNWPVAAHTDSSQMYLGHQTAITPNQNVAGLYNSASLQTHNLLQPHFAVALHMPPSSEVPAIAP